MTQVQILVQVYILLSHSSLLLAALATHVDPPLFVAESEDEAPPPKKVNGTAKVPPKINGKQTADSSR